MRVVTWNVNSIRSRQPRVLAWITEHQPDVVLLQETKCTDAAFASDEIAGEYSRLGYEVAHHGVDHWNGVAILSRVGLEGVNRGFPGTNRQPYNEARIISADCAGIRFCSVYVPNGRELDDPHYLFKLVWLERLRASLEPSRTMMLAGDLNVAPTDQDIYAPERWKKRTHASAPERAAITAITDLGLRDVTREHLPHDGVFTWWSYRPGQFEKNHGMRLDIAYCSPDLASRTSSVWIDTIERGTREVAGKRPSDHAPLVIDLD